MLKWYEPRESLLSDKRVWSTRRIRHRFNSHQWSCLSWWDLAHGRVLSDRAEFLLLGQGQDWLAPWGVLHLSWLCFHCQSMPRKVWIASLSSKRPFPEFSWCPINCRWNRRRSFWLAARLKKSRFQKMSSRLTKNPFKNTGKWLNTVKQSATS